MGKISFVVVIILVLVLLGAAAVFLGSEETESDQVFIVDYVSKEVIYPAYGYNGAGHAIVREDLPPRVKQFVTAHELYHLRDTATWGGWLGRELRANIVPGFRDPVGLLATITSTVTDWDRISFYLQRLREGR